MPPGAIHSTWIGVILAVLMCSHTRATNDSNSRVLRLLSSAESRLYADLTTRAAHFGRRARPVLDPSRHIPVRYGVSLNQILSFDARRQMLTTHVWQMYSWHNEILQWEPAEYGGLHVVHLPRDVMWTPDIILYNSADDKQSGEEKSVVLYADGTVQWIPSSIFHSTCAVDMRHFPFDVQTCRMVFGSWVYSADKLTLHFYEDLADLHTTEFTESSEFIVQSSAANLTSRTFNCCAQSYDLMTFQLTLRRRHDFYVYVLLIPSVLLGCLMLVLFWIPADRPDRTGLGMSLFTSFFVLLLVVVTSSPPSSKSISLLGIYYTVNLVLLTLATSLSVLVINISRCEKPMPEVLRKIIIHWIGKVVWVPIYFNAKRPISLIKDHDEVIEINNEKRRQNTFPGNMQQREISRDWKMAAYVIDRLLFFVFLTAILVTFLTAFPSRE